MIVSFGVTAMLIGVTVAGLLAPVPGPARWLMVLTPSILLLGSAPFAIRGYSVRGRRLVIHRLMWDTEFPLDRLKEASAMPGAMKRSIRLMGNGGLFSFTGLYSNRSLGRYRAFATDFDRTVVLKLSDRTLVVSPDAPEEFVQAVKAAVDLPG